MAYFEQVFVGRQQELGELRAALDAAKSGSGRTVVLAGEPGIGKTRTTQELASAAGQQGFQVLWGRCYEGEGAPPYWTWVQPLTSYIQQADADKLSSELGKGATNIAGIVPELHTKLPESEHSPQTEPEQARFSLFQSIASFLKNISESKPTMLVLEDLHWADNSSLSLFEFVAKETASSSLMIVGTYRDIEVSRRDPLSETLGRISREPSFSRIELAGLDEQEVANLIEMGSGQRSSDEVVRTIHSRTEGNPLFIGQLIPLIETDSEDWVTAIPDAVRDAISERLNRLSDECNRILTLASVIGREFDFDLLSHIADVSDDDLLNIVEEGLNAQVIEDLPGLSERYQFSHALIQETLYQELSSSRRIRIHARIGERLENLRDENLSAYAPLLVHHFTQSEGLTGTERLLPYLVMAGEQALASYAWEEARTHFDTAFAIKESRPMDDEKARILFGLARAQRATLPRSDTMRPIETVTPAFNYYEESGDTTRALEIAEYPFGASFGYGSNAELLGRAVNLSSKGSVQHGHFLSRYGHAYYHQTGDADAAKKAFDEAMSIALQYKDVELKAQVLNDMGMFLEGEESFEESLTAALEVIELSSSNVDVPVSHESRPHNRAVNASIALGDLDKAGQLALGSLDNAEPYPSVSGVAYALFNNDLVARLRGDWMESRHFNDRGLELAPTDVRMIYSRALLEHQVGDFSLGEVYLERLINVVFSSPPVPSLSYSLVPPTIALVAYITGDTSRFSLLTSVIEEVLSVPHAIKHPYWHGLVGSGLKAVITKDTDAASRHYEALKTYPNPMQGWGKISNDRFLGLLSATMGNPEKAISHFEDALIRCRQGGFIPELAWTCYDYANMRVKARDSLKDEEERVVALVEEGLSISTILGMKPLMERLTALKEQIEPAASQQPIHVYPKGLTEREVEVLGLVAQGRTNQEIADELVISTRTVQNHLSHIYPKIDARNRAEATAFFMKNLLSLE